jgi:hypothetical protein
MMPSPYRSAAPAPRIKPERWFDKIDTGDIGGVAMLVGELLLFIGTLGEIVISCGGGIIFLSGIIVEALPVKYPFRNIERGK